VKKHLTNAAYGALDYASYPLGMLVVAPIVLHKLGASEYGLWAVSTAVVSIGGVLASGFCDANVQHVARLRGGTDMIPGDTDSMAFSVRNVFGVNLMLGILLCALVWAAAPVAAARITAAHPAQLSECLIDLRIAGIAVLVRAAESAFVSTQRAFEQFRTWAQINTCIRLLTLATAVALALLGRSTVSIMAATCLFLALATFLHSLRARKLLGVSSLAPVFQLSETRILLRTGIFSWLHAFGSIVFGQMDRVILGVSLGAAAVAPYTLCVQFTQPIVGLTGSGLQFLFPYLSRHVGAGSEAAFRKAFLGATLCNLALVSCGAGMLLLVGHRLITAWAGAPVATAAAPILPRIVFGAALSGFSVTATYALLALGQFRTVAAISLSSRGVMLLVMMYLLHSDGLQGLATARLSYGLLALLLYAPLLRLPAFTQTGDPTSATATASTQEALNP
jgi:O-antigen/teichoic acid export membrane protein